MEPGAQRHSAILNWQTELWGGDDELFFYAGGAIFRFFVVVEERREFSSLGGIREMNGVVSSELTDVESHNNLILVYHVPVPAHDHPST